ncbi:single-pass membrane and coiled-coil domain-containing protein 4 isoform X1 [Bos javanicus]|uniref:single-pass membrane and coiled-coil domain-containing protein 4 isoform X1 n=1 Tax=Bos taurus TaxID=9913 RepID=UPI000D53BDAF|nr:single-pass membrane and coiled-coil domain-containing protein 4 isoform X1 [Bos taurus]XP_059738994.1 single-pass membrane and coiled-coil domain-containing protein 4 isoform X1 [Bos taurus]XP_059738995.1 single-pass membrane and coiled-coil domain-containing protein 4 isoform X1 [Bos taurus]XP_061261959.1 single-pass membrane and coiled-coil domain-containing protein 4 isoform X1 [Bos javanicus]XP_061261960.1 single-pass membrane and coiled-coil domain-containing protein 4 isoform X1 [Bos 
MSSGSTWSSLARRIPPGSLLAVDSGQSLSRSSEALPAHPVLDAEKLKCHGWHGAGIIQITFPGSQFAETTEASSSWKLKKRRSGALT